MNLTSTTDQSQVPQGDYGGLAESRSDLIDRRLKQAEQLDPNAVYSSLYARVMRGYANARRHRENHIDGLLLECLRMRKRVFSPEQIQILNAQNSPGIYMGVVAKKCFDAESWLNDILRSNEDRLYDLSPSSLPDLGEDMVAKIRDLSIAAYAQAVEQGQEVTEDNIRDYAAKMREVVEAQLEAEAHRKTDAHQDLIDDQLQACEFDELIDEVIKDIVTFPCAYLKGPIVQIRRRPKYIDGPDGTKAFAVVEEPILCYTKPSPFDVYPGEFSKDPQTDDMYERMYFTVTDLQSYKGVEGYLDHNIDSVIAEYGMTGYHVERTNDTSRRGLENNNLGMPSGDKRNIEGVEFQGRVMGKEMLEFRGDLNLDPLREYSASIVIAANTVIRAVINPHPLGYNLYLKASLEDIPGSFYGEGLPQKLEDCQKLCNSCASALARNMGISSGPIGVFDIGRMASGQDVTQVSPLSVIQTEDTQGTHSSKPFDMHVVPSLAEELLPIYQAFKSEADELSGFPKYNFGSDEVSGAGQTARGLSMLMSASGKTIRNVLRKISSKIITKAVESLYYYNMAYHPDDSIKADAQVVVSGILQSILAEQHTQRRIEYLNLTNNAIDHQLVGLTRRARILRSTAKSMDLDPDDAAPDEEEAAQIEERLAQAAAEAAGTTVSKERTKPRAPQRRVPEQRQSEHDGANRP